MNFLPASCVPDTTLGTWNTSVNKRAESAVAGGAYILSQWIWRQVCLMPKWCGLHEILQWHYWDSLVFSLVQSTSLSWPEPQWYNPTFLGSMHIWMTHDQLQLIYSKIYLPPSCQNHRQGLVTFLWCLEAHKAHLYRISCLVLLTTSQATTKSEIMILSYSL